MARRPTIGVVGFGCAGGAIALALHEAGYKLQACWSRSRSGRQRATRLLPDIPVLTDPADVAGAADLVFLAVPDDAIADVAAAVVPGARPGQHVVHTSGATSVETLADLAAKGVKTGSMHPLQTLPDARRGAEALRGAAVAVTCDEQDRRLLHRVASGWGGRPFPLPDEAKTLYHAAAVFASNYLVSVLWAAHRLLEEAGVQQVRTLLTPLVAATVDNVAGRGPERSLTGPVARGDVGAVRRHLEALEDRAPQLAETYRALAVLTARLNGEHVAEVEEAIA